MFDQPARMRRQSLKLPHAQAQTARRPSVGQPDRPDRHRPARPPRGGFRHDADADILRDHLADAFKAAHPHAERKRPPGKDRMFAEIILQRAAGAQADELMRDDILKRDASKCRQRAFARRDDDEAVDGEGPQLQSAMIDGVRNDADIGEAAGDSLHDLGAEAFFQIDVDMRMARQIGRERLGQKLGHGGGVRLQSHMALEAFGVVPQFSAQLLDLPQHDPRVMGERIAGGRRLRRRAGRDRAGAGRSPPPCRAGGRWPKPEPYSPAPRRG